VTENQVVRPPAVPGALRPENVATAERILRLIGLGVRSRGVVVGVERVRTAAKNGSLRLGIVAADASANSLEKVVPLLSARGIRFIEVPSAARLGAIVGREQTAAVGVTDAPLAKGIRTLVRPAGSTGSRSKEGV
jgi:ribosomal protein L7Ae-like RNA K-turn-binding protein